MVTPELVAKWGKVGHRGIQAGRFPRRLSHHGGQGTAGSESVLAEARWVQHAADDGDLLSQSNAYQQNAPARESHFEV